jgi:hypothetical protein
MAINARQMRGLARRDSGKVGRKVELKLRLKAGIHRRVKLYL